MRSATLVILFSVLFAVIVAQEPAEEEDNNDDMKDMTVQVQQLSLQSLLELASNDGLEISQHMKEACNECGEEEGGEE